MYESPITITERIVNKAREQTENDITNNILTATAEYGVVVNKDELIKALQHDRNQYQKGYNDAVREFTERLKDHFSTDIMLITQERYMVDNAVDNIANELLGGEH